MRFTSALPAEPTRWCIALLNIPWSWEFTIPVILSKKSGTRKKNACSRELPVQTACGRWLHISTSKPLIFMIRSVVLYLVCVIQVIESVGHFCSHFDGVCIYVFETIWACERRHREKESVWLMISFKQRPPLINVRTRAPRVERWPWLYRKSHLPRVKSAKFTDYTAATMF